MKRYLQLLPFAYLLYRFYLDSINHTLQLVLVIGAVAFYLLRNLPQVLRKFRAEYVFVKCACWVGAVVALSAVIPVLRGTFDFSYTRVLLSELMEMVCWLAFACHVGKRARKDRVLVEFTDELCMITVLYVGFSVFCLLVPPFKAFWMDLLPLTSRHLSLLEIKSYAARFGWDGFAGYTATYMCTICVMLCLVQIDRVLHCRRTCEQENIRKWVVYLAVMLLGNSFYGRTGLVTSALLVGLFLVRELILRKEKKLFQAVGIGALCLAVAVVLAYFVITPIRPVIEWVFEPFLNLFRGKGFTSTSVENLANMAKVDLTPGTVLFGDGYYTDPVSGAYYKKVDIGFLRMLLFGGIFYVALILGTLVTMGLSSSMPTAFTAALMLVLFGLFEFKGEAHCLAGNIGMAIVILTPKRDKNRRRCPVILRISGIIRKLGSKL